MGAYKLTSSAQQEALLSLDKLSKDEIQGYFSFSRSDVKFILSHRGVENRLGIGLQLCLARYPGISLNSVDKVSKSLVEYVADQLKISTIDLDNYLSKKNTPLVHLKKICRHYNYSLYSSKASNYLKNILNEAIQENNDELCLINLAIYRLIEQHILLPELSEIERLISTIRHSTSITLDGFSGKHVKIFIDGVPQEGVGSSFGLNNIPINFADRIEVYKGVVPVGFGTDALGGVINIVTNKKRRNWFVDASYSYGSFNTHKSYINFGQTFKNGFTYEINAFQNYSDNDYHVDAPIKRYKEDGTTDFDTEKTERVKRFHDTYHNEAVVAKIGVEDKRWADRLMFGFTYSNMYQEIQTGVRQKTVFGEKHRKGHSLMPSLEYNKHNLFTKGLDVVLTANYNRNITYNVDTTRYEYNWLGEKKLMNSRGEQSYQHTRSNNDNWNATLTVNYQIARIHMLTFNNVWNAFHRNNTSLLAEEEATDAIAKETRKNIAGLSYRLMPSDRWNLSVFGKYYRQYVAGPMATDDNASDYVRTSRTTDSWGYGIAGTYFILSGLQTKLSYEKAYRLPTIEEMFGDEDLESGNIAIRPENSNNINVNLSYTKTFGKHSVYVEGGFIYRNTQDYIQRNIQDLSGGKENATYINYGKVLTKGFNISARYGFSKWLSIGGNFTKMDVRDNEEYQIGSMGNTVKNLAYKSRMPNVPYIFSDSDINFYWHGLFKKGNVLTVTYDNLYLHSFSYYSQAIGKKSDFVVPNQFSHNLTVSYSIRKGRYNFSFECRNLTNEKLYDNFSLQKAGRAFYGKVRVYFGK